MQGAKKLNQLLKEAGQYHPHYGDRLANHLPMTLVALANLGASDEKLTVFFKENVAGLEPIEELDKVEVIENIEQYLGDSSKYNSLLKYFTRQIAAVGVDAVIRKTLPLLLPGISASAFHALIRLGYAIEANNDNEVAISLAYWCTEFQAFALSEQTTTDTLEGSLAKLAPLGVKHTFSPGIIVDRMAEIGELLRQGNYQYLPENINFFKLRELCLKAFYLQNNFTLLHTVTGCHAFSIILPYIQDVDLALKELYKAIVVAYLSTGLTFDDLDIALPESNGDFSPLIAQALMAHDSHVIKLVYSCVKEYAKDKEPLYLCLAKRAVSKD